MCSDHEGQAVCVVSLGTGRTTRPRLPHTRRRSDPPHATSCPGLAGAWASAASSTTTTTLRTSWRARCWARGLGCSTRDEPSPAPRSCIMCWLSKPETWTCCFHPTTKAAAAAAATGLEGRIEMCCVPVAPRVPVSPGGRKRRGDAPAAPNPTPVTQPTQPMNTVGCLLCCTATRFPCSDPLPSPTDATRSLMCHRVYRVCYRFNCHRPSRLFSCHNAMRGEVQWRCHQAAHSTGSGFRCRAGATMHGMEQGQLRQAAAVAKNTVHESGKWQWIVVGQNRGCNWKKGGRLKSKGGKHRASRQRQVVWVQPASRQWGSYECSARHGSRRRQGQQSRKLHGKKQLRAQVSIRLPRRAWTHRAVRLPASEPCAPATTLQTLAW